MTINQKPVSITGTRTYNATAITLPTDLSIGGLVGGETISLSGQGTIADKNVGAGKTITLNTLTLNDGANPTHLASNYTFTGGTHTFDVTKRTLTFSGTKVYDGTRTVSPSELTTITNLAGGETLTFTGSGTVASANVQSGQSVSNGTLSINDGSGLASNYNLTTGTFNISQRWVTLSGTRNYDGTNTAGSSDLTISNLVSGETLGLTGNGTVASKDVGSNKAITDVSLTLTDGSGLAANYTIGTKTFNITQKAVTIDGSKVYDGNTSVSSTDISTFNGLALTETLTINGTGSVAAPQVGTNKTLTFGTLTIANGTNGGLASNYTLTSGTFDVTARPITLSGSRVYDGSTTVSNSNLSTFTNIVSGEALAITGSGTIVVEKNVGSTKAVTLGTLALADNTASASNYSLNSATLDVTQRPLNITATKAYDGNTTISASSVSLLNLVGGETLNKSGTVTTNSTNVGSFATSDIAVSSLSLANGTGTASNYTLSGGTYSATITQKTVGLSGSKVYDATSVVNSSDLTLTGTVGTETLTLSGSGALATSAIGTGKTITLGSLAISDNGGLASNYSLSGTATMNVTARPVTVSGSRVYDGTTTINGTALTTVSNLAGSDTLSVTGSGTSTADVGNSKSVTLGSLALVSGSGNAANYSLSSATVNITQRPLDLQASRIYNGTVTINGSDFSTFSNIVSGQTLSAIWFWDSFIS